MEDMVSNLHHLKLSQLFLQPTTCSFVFYFPNIIPLFIHISYLQSDTKFSKSTSKHSKHQPLPCSFLEQFANYYFLSMVTKTSTTKSLKHESMKDWYKQIC